MKITNKAAIEIEYDEIQRIIESYVIEKMREQGFEVDTIKVSEGSYDDLAMEVTAVTNL